MSEYVSAILLTSITLAVGALIIIGLYSWYTGLISDLTLQRARYSIELSEALGIAAAYINSSNYIIAVLVTGPNPVRLLSIYVNDTLVTSAVIEHDGGSTTFTGKPLTLEGYSAYVVAINGSQYASSVSSARVKIVYEGGSLEAVASRIE